MRAKKTYLCFGFLSLWLFGFSISSIAQTYLGVTVTDEEELEQVTQQLDLLQNYGIQYIEIATEADRQELNELSGQGFTLLVRSNIKFLTAANVDRSREQIQTDLFELNDRLIDMPDLEGLGVFSNSATYSQAFNGAFDPIFSTLRAQSDLTLYFVNHDQWFSMDSPTDAFGELFDFKKYPVNTLQHFDRWFTNKLENKSGQILFFPADWLLSLNKNYPAFDASLKEFAETGNWLLPLPEPESPGPSLNILVLLLLVLWGSLAMQMRYLPYIRPMILRYFLAHRFFVDDILHYREREATGSLLMMLSHAIFGGMVSYISAGILLNDAGVSAFFHHFPYLALVGPNLGSFFAAGALIVLLTQVVAILWLHLPAKNIDHISQTLNLYASLFYLDFFIVTLMLPLFLTNTWPILTLSLGVFYVLIWFASFNITAYNASKAMGPDRFMYLLLTIGLHLVVFLGAIVLLMVSTEIEEVLALSFSL